MALDENARAANVVGSIQDYVDAHLADVLNSSRSAIDYGGGLPFRDDDLDQWIQVRAMGLSRPAYVGLQVGISVGFEGPFNARGDRAREVFWLLNVNCFVRPARADTFSNLQIWRLRDAVVDAFFVGALIPVKDYFGTGETLGNLFLYDIMADREISQPDRSELVQHNMQFMLRWSESWTSDV